MKIKFLKVSANRSLWFFSILAGLLWGYSIACHFIDFYHKSWGERSLVLIGCAAIASLHAYKLAQVTWPRLKSQDYPAYVRNALLLVGLVFVLFPTILPVYPMMRNLEIATAGDKNVASSGNVVEITSIHNNDLPIQNYTLKGKWQRQGDTLLTTGIQPASLSFAEFTQGKAAVQITFRKTPASGRVTITWDGVSEMVDLYSATKGRSVIDLAPTFPWQELGLRRQTFLMTTIISDFLSLAILILAIETWLIVLIKRVKPAPYLAKAGPVVLVLCLLLSLGWNVVNLSKSKTGFEIFVDPQTSNRLDELLSHSASYKQTLVYTTLSEIFSGRSLIISPGLIQDFELDLVQIKSIGRLSAIKQISYPVELTSAEAQGLLKLNHRDLVYDPAGPKYTFITQPSSLNTPLCMKTYRGSAFIGPVTLMSGCQGLQ